MTDSPAASETPPAPPEPPPARWPEWFHGLDVTAAALAVAAVFLASSSAARNSPAFLHFAGGRALVKGQHGLGTDPFTHAGAAGRPWADTNWLFDLVAYALYSVDAGGAAVTAVKAIGVAVAVGLLFLLRGTGRPLFPWVVAVVIAAVALADTVPLASATASVLFLAATLALVFRLDWSRPGWRNPLVLGGLFAVWANTDGWFLLGPVVVLVVWVGAKVDRAMGRTDGGKAGLGRGLLVGVVACLLNPFVLAAAAKSPNEALTQLVPWEFGLHLPSNVVDDVQLGNSLTLRPLSDVILDRVQRGDDPNLPAFGLLAVLSVAGAVAAGLFGRAATPALLTILGVVVGLINLRLTPLAAVLLIPAVGWGLNLLAERIRVGRADDPATRILITVSGLGRFLALLAAVAVGVAAYPGWLHPPRLDAAYGKVYTQRVEWAVEPDASLERTARMMADWPADRKCLAVGPDLANYAAWYAPGVRQFVNTRYGFHRDDLPDLLVLRVAVLGRRNGPPTEASDLDDAGTACDRQGGGYLVVTTGAPARRVDDLNFINKQVPAVYALGLFAGDQWTLWHLDGRSAVIGRKTGGPAFDPVATAFRKGEALPPGPTNPPPLPPSEDLIVQAIEQARNPIHPPPPEADDALTYAGFLTQVVRPQAEADYRRRAAPPRGALTGGLGLLVNLSGRPPSEAELAVPVLAVRAARRAVAAAPDRPEPYRALLTAYALPGSPAAVGPYSPAAGLLDGQPEAESQQLAAAARFVARYPVATAGRDLLSSGLETMFALAAMYEQTSQIDLARETLDKAELLLKRLPSGGKDDPVAAEKKKLEERLDGLSGQIGKRLKAADQVKEPDRKMVVLAQLGLPGKAIAHYRAADASSFGQSLAGMTLLLVQIELRAGRVEDAATDLTALEEALRAAPSPDPVIVGQVGLFRAVVARLAGDPRAAAGTAASAPNANLPLDLAKRLREAPNVATALSAAAGVPAALVFQSSIDAQSRGMRAALEVETSQQNDRALLALLDGDPTEAGRRFDAALKPLGLDLVDFNQPMADRLVQYRELVRRYGGK